MFFCSLHSIKKHIIEELSLLIDNAFKNKGKDIQYHEFTLINDEVKYIKYKIYFYCVCVPGR